MTLASKYDESASAYDTWVEYVYCPSCGGAMTERIEYSDAGTTVSSWLRYQYEGLNLLRIDERYDGADAGTAINDGDPWRPTNRIENSPTWELMTSIGQAGPAHMFLDIGSGLRSAVGSNVSPSDDESGPKEHLTGKMLDDDTAPLLLPRPLVRPTSGEVYRKRSCERVRWISIYVCFR